MKNSNVYISSILESIEAIEGYIYGMDKETFLHSPMIQDAVVWRIAIIGEAAKHLDQPSRNSFATIPWKKMAGMRDVLIHDYIGIDLDAVWQTITEELPPVAEEIEKNLQK